MDIDSLEAQYLCAPGYLIGCGVEFIFVYAIFSSPLGSFCTVAA